MFRIRLPIICLVLVLLAGVAQAAVVRIEIRSRSDFGTHERIVARVFFAVNPTDAANQTIADITLAPRNAAGLVEFSSDLLYFQPKDASRARGTVFLEAVNRGRDQSLIIMSDARTRDFAPAAWDMGDRFVLQQGFAAAFLGWQFDVSADDGLTFEAPVAPVEGTVRATYIETDEGGQTATGFRLAYCSSLRQDPLARLSYRRRLDDAPVLVPRASWQFSQDGCVVTIRGALHPGAYEVTYTAKGSPVAALGLAALRDFASYLKYGGATTTLRENPALSRRVIGYGYSQSARLFRDFVRDGFNADERGRQAFDALMISSAGAGGGSFNHRFAMPGQAGNSVLSILRPVDIPPFTDEGLLARANATRTTPRIFYTFSSTEYWARAGALTHTTDDGLRDVPLGANSRLYFLTGTPHASGPLPSRRGLRYQGYENGVNFAEQRWAQRALLLDLDDWVAKGTTPPPSRYPTIARGELVARDAITFPAIPGLPFAPYLPPVFRLDFGSAFGTTRIITSEPPVVGAPYTVLLPQVDADGNDRGGVRLPEVTVPLGTHTGWNMSVPPLSGLRYLAGLIGSFEPFARTRAEREANGDPRLSIDERYKSRDDYLDRIKRAADDLVKERFMLSADVPAVVERAGRLWDALR
jgi:hypothetical protein